MSTRSRHSWTDIRDRIQAMIQAQTYGPGDKLPRDEDIAARLGCARATVQRAMRALADTGMVERRRRGGTTVTRDPVTRATFDIPVTRREVESRGAAYGHQLLSKSLRRTPPGVTARFGLEVPRRMLHLEALHLADGRPFMAEDRWISTDTVPEIAEVDLSRISANEWLVRNRPYSRCELRLFARNAAAADAAVMEVAEGTALLVLERTTWIGADPITSVRALTAPGYQLSTEV